MTQVEQLMLKLGVDNSAVAKGMRGMTNTVTEGLHDIKREIAGAFSIGATIGFFEKVIDHFDEIKDRAENLNVGTDFFQGMQRTFETSGSSAENFAKAMDKLNVKIGEAKSGNQQAQESFAKIGISMGQLQRMSVEEVFYAVSDGLKQTGDNSLIAAGAVDIFGKSGASMVAVMNEGSESLKRMVEAAHKLSEEDVKFLAQTKDDLKNVGETSMVWGGKLLALVKNVAAAYGEMSAAATGTDMRAAIKEQVHRARELERQATIAKVNAEDAAEKAKILADIEAKAAKEKLAAIEKEKLAQAELEAQQKKNNERLKEENRLLGEKWKAAQKASKLAKEIGAAQSARTEWSLSEIASLDPAMLNRQSQWKIGAAQDVEDMRKEARFLRLEGNDAGAKELLSRSDQLAKSIGGLSASEADPIGTLIAQAKEQLDAMKEIGATVEGNALRIIVANSK